MQRPSATAFPYAPLWNDCEQSSRPVGGGCDHEDKLRPGVRSLAIASGFRHDESQFDARVEATGRDVFRRDLSLPHVLFSLSEGP